MLKRCGCGAAWRTLEHLLVDPAVSLLGFQPGPGAETEGAYLFNHLTCGNTLALRENTVGAFRRAN
jgi:hypothetical protein